MLCNSLKNQLQTQHPDAVIELLLIAWQLHELQHVQEVLINELQEPTQCVGVRLAVHSIFLTYVFSCHSKTAS